MSDVHALIPARWGSSRLPGKPGALINGVPLLVHSYRAATAAFGSDAVRIVAADDRVAELAREWDLPAFHQFRAYRTGSDRIAAAAKELELDGFVVNVQGDIAQLDSAALDAVAAARINDADVPMITAATTAESDQPGVLCFHDAHGRATFFSREAPATKSMPSAERQPNGAPLGIARHVGVYAFTAESLQRFGESPTSPWEHAYGLEQMRALQNGWEIRVVVGDWEYQDVNNVDDVTRLHRRTIA